MRGVAGCMLVMVGLAALAGGAFGQQREEEPEPRARLIVPSGAGGGSDLVARRLAPLLGESLGMPLDVVNRPGPDGLRAVAEAGPDGTTLALVGAEMLVGLPNPRPRVTPLLLFNLDPPTLHLRAGDRAEGTIAAVLDGSASASGGPPGSLWHHTLAHMAAARGRDLPGGAWSPSHDETRAIDRLTGGEIPMVVAGPAAADAARRAGLVESDGAAAGLPGTLTGWRGLVAPPGLSRRATERLLEAARAATADPAFRRFMTIRGYRPGDMEGEAFAAFLERFDSELDLARTALR